MDEIIGEGYNLLNLIRFFTVGKDEVRSWSVRRNSTAPKAGGMIHTDFDKVILIIHNL